MISSNAPEYEMYITVSIFYFTDEDNSSTNTHDYEMYITVSIFYITDEDNSSTFKTTLSKETLVKKK